MSWWLWLIVAWLVISVPFAVITAKFIAVGREDADAAGGGAAHHDPEPVIDLAAAEAAEAAEGAEAGPQRPTPAGPATGSQPAHSN